MIFIILMMLEGLCTLPLIYLRDKKGKRKITEKELDTIEVLFVIIASIINWFCYGAYQQGPYIIMYDQFGAENPENIVGLIWSVGPPVLVCFISFLLYIIMREIRYRINIAKEKREKK